MSSGSAALIRLTSALASGLFPWPCGFALKHVELSEHLVQFIELLLYRLLLVQQLLPLVQQFFALSRDKCFGFGQNGTLHVNPPYRLEALVPRLCLREKRFK